MRKEFVRLMLEMGGKEERLVILAGDISVFGLREFRKNYPERFYNIGICEQSMMSMASGMALAGLIPVVHSIAPFVTERCFEQIKDDFCYQGVGGNIVSVGSAFDYSGLGCTHHTYSDIAILRSLPNTEVVYPSSPKELEVLFKQSFDNGKLTYFRLPERKHTQQIDESIIKFGRGVVIKDGIDITIVVSGPQVDNAAKASATLKKDGIDAEIIYIHTIKPMDKELIIESARKTGKVLTVEEASIRGGLGDEVSMVLGELGNIEMYRMGVGDKFITDYGKYDDLCRSSGLNEEEIANKIRSIVANE
ncbi:MAG TPA: hypothetical protein HA282_03495 [Nanoarchaeota archaeon]|nr:hypothetical protein [Nanoarchaeota archaeon]HIH34046.1 hypothetical protein [Nanoarchaeota archaeon]HIH51660.1 hypothetical protein [Nanoarchaeota archaeon]HIH66253.1 hypothetical protein [Nanoarchaeota archaeon]